MKRIVQTLQWNTSLVTPNIQLLLVCFRVTQDTWRENVAAETQEYLVSTCRGHYKTKAMAKRGQAEAQAQGRHPP